MEWKDLTAPDRGTGLTVYERKLCRSESMLMGTSYAVVVEVTIRRRDL